MGWALGMFVWSLPRTPTVRCSFVCATPHRHGDIRVPYFSCVVCLPKNEKKRDETLKRLTVGTFIHTFARSWFSAI